MRAFLYFLAICVLANGISSVAVMRDLSVAIGILCALMHVAVACAFLLPVLPIGRKGWIAGLITVHFLAGAYWAYMSPWLDQRLIDEILNRMAHREGRTGLSDYLSLEVEFSVVSMSIYRQKTEFPVSILAWLDVVWLVWLIVKATAARTSEPGMKPSKNTC